MARIEILAGMGSGKTSLAKLLEKKGFTHIEEEFENNPFLEQIYEDGQNWFEYGMVNLMIHYNQLYKNDEPGEDYVFDFSVLLDRAYGETHLELGLLTEKEMVAYEEVDKRVRRQMPKPDLRIFLKCPPEEQKRRILERGRGYESGIELEFLEMMDKNTQRFLKERGQDTKVLVIDTAKYDYVKNPAHRKAVLEKIAQALGDKAPEPMKPEEKEPFRPKPPRGPSPF